MVGSDSQRPFLFPFLIAASLLVVSALMFVFFSIETLTEEERLKAKAMRAQMRV